MKISVGTGNFVELKYNCCQNAKLFEITGGVDEKLWISITYVHLYYLQNEKLKFGNAQTMLSRYLQFNILPVTCPIRLAYLYYSLCMTLGTGIAFDYINSQDNPI